MGIHGLSKVISECAPRAIKQHNIGEYFGRKIAIDASMSIYQFLIAVRSEDGSMLADENGKTTSHLMGLFYRTIRMIECGIKPVYVFDGAPPKLKTAEVRVPSHFTKLDDRLAKREEANKEILSAQASGTAILIFYLLSDQPEVVGKFMKRTVKVTKEHIAEAKKLLTLMGVPFIQAPGEAEAQCAAMAKAGLVFATGSEDMDTLTFGSPILLRNLTFSEARKIPITEMHLDEVLVGLGMAMDQFIDLCILLGCDYCDSIKGIGPQKAIKLIREHGSLEKIISHLKENPSSKHVVPENFPFQEARILFQQPSVLDAAEFESLLKPSVVSQDELIAFLVTEKGFSEERIRSGIKKLEKNMTQSTQCRIDSFFKKSNNSTSRISDTTGPSTVTQVHILMN
ncbi:Elongation of fatty acids protein 2 [Mitosporidium daphniae]